MNKLIKIKYDENYKEKIISKISELNNEESIKILIKRKDIKISILTNIPPLLNKEETIEKIDNALLNQETYSYKDLKDYPIEYISLIQKNYKTIEKKKIDSELIKKHKLITNKEFKDEKNKDSVIIKDSKNKAVVKTKEGVLLFEEKYIKNKNIIIRKNLIKKDENLIFYLKNNKEIDYIEKKIILNTIKKKNKQKYKEIDYAVLLYEDNKFEIANKKESIKTDIEDVLKWIDKNNIKKIYTDDYETNILFFHKIIEKTYMKKGYTKENKLLSWQFSYNYKEYKVSTWKNILPIKKNEILEAFNIEKSNKAIDYWKAISTYNKWLYEIINYNIWDYDNLSILTFKAWLSTIENEDNIPIINDNTAKKDIINLEKACRKSYKTGYIEVYKPYIKKGYKYDINSLYPYIMINKEYPVGKEVIWSTDKKLKNYYGLVKAKIKKENTYKDILLNDNKTSNEWIDWYSSEEIRWAKKVNKNLKIEILEGYKFLKKKKIFFKYLNKLNNIKEQKNLNKKKKNIIKILMNHLNGILGRNEAYASTYITTWNIKRNNERIIYEEKYENNITQRIIEKNNKNESNVGISSWTNSLARIYMNKFRLKKETEYIFIDGIITNKKINDRWISENKAGLLKLEDEIKECIILGPNKLAYKNKKNEEKIVWPIIKDSKIEYKDFKEALFENKQKQIKVTHKKRDIFKNKIKKTNLKINIITDLSKRKKVYNKEGVWVDTK